ncbi:Uu.00g109200.m01.CDS01 [Anthostomella pinea]|uniref:Uu.00g109200.m01.CDS01 n=1 Tax=Anthostomella pinea TaxID=933095 RepID=A0AAI8VEN9_9PEZI|nr:Uu.00g109200.m01.CDS01 [Anthostomella pinea]
MPPKSALPDTVYAISSFIWDDDDNIEGLQPTEVYKTLAAANTAAKKMMARYAEMLNPYGTIDEYNFHHDENDEGLYHGHMDGGPHGHVATRIRVCKTTLNAGGDTQPAKGKRAIKSDPDEEAPRPSKKRAAAPSNTAVKHAKTGRKVIPQGQPDCLAGLKLLFTGTFDNMDRKTSVATAMKYGAEVISKLEDTDYIVIGTRAGPNKLREINEKELETISEEEFFQILENGIPQEKKGRMENRRLADRNESPEEDDEEEEEEEEEKPKKPKRRAPVKRGAK